MNKKPTTKKAKIKDKKAAPLVMFLDIETNGLPLKKQGYNTYYPPTELDKYEPSRIIAMSWLICDFKGNQKISKTLYVKPNGFKITNSNIHGITEEMANKDGVSVTKLFNEFNKDLKDVKVLVAHNLEFDYNILLSELHRSGKRPNLIKKINGLEKSCTGEQTKNILKIPFKSSYVISKYKMPRLPELYEYCFKKPMLNHHNPEYDVKHLSECFFYLLK